MSFMEDITKGQRSLGHAPTAPRPRLAMPRESMMTAFAFAIVAFFHLHLAFTRTIHWDEFHYYGQVVSFMRGDSIPVLQTLHVYLFAWLPGAASSGIDAILVARGFMLVCEAATVCFIVLVAERFARREHALLAGLIWLAMGYTIHHGASFRTDPVATALVMGSLAVLTRARLSLTMAGLAGVLVGLAGAITIKAILFLPAFIGIAALRWAENRCDLHSALRIATIPVLALGVLAAFVLIHSGNLPDADTSSANAQIGGSSEAMMFAGWPIYLPFFPRWAILSVPAVLVMGLTVLHLRRRPPIEMIALIGLVAPILCVLLYRNTLPYFYPTMLAPVIAASAIGVAAFARRFGTRRLLTYIIISASLVWTLDQPSRIDAQRDIQAAADVIFPETVHYLDFPGMLPNHRKANGFLSRWGMQAYRDNGPGQYRAILERETVPLLLAAESQLDPTLSAVVNGGPQAERFYPDDVAVLQATYRPFWGPFWLAGTQIAAGSEAEYEVLVPGNYTVTGSSIMIDGERFSAGSVLPLDRGSITLRNEGASEAGIVWGDNPAVPDWPVPDRPYWRGF